jgi:hypothetical protein
VPLEGSALRRPLLVLLASTSLCLGCRTVWIHPNATPEKFETEKAQCLREIGSPPSDGVAYRNWKACLLANGWTATTGFRSSPAVRPPLAKTDKKVRGPRGRL